MSKDELGDRMKEYESAGQTRLVRRLPVLIRVDGRAFHTLTRGMNKPVDERFRDCMWFAAKALCEEAQGARLGYVQSDEISVLLYERDVHSDGWFGYDRDKVISSSAATATAAFLIRFAQLFPEVELRPRTAPKFDSRATNYPLHEVVNYFIWRQQDATRNSILGLGMSHFSHAALHGKNTSQVQDMLHEEKGVNWNDCPTTQKRGACVVKQTYAVEAGQVIDGHEVKEDTERSRWVIDEDIPIFTQERYYIAQHMTMANAGDT